LILLPAEHEKCRAENYVCASGGSASNTAVELSRLGRKVTIVGGIGPLLNDYLTGMTDLVFANDGTVARGSRIDIVVRKCSGASNMPACWAIPQVGGRRDRPLLFCDREVIRQTNNVQKLRALIGNPRLSQQLMGQVPIFCGPKVEKFNSILSL
jgi:hypothetical protein